MINLKWIKSLTLFLGAADKFMPELHLRKPWFTYSADGQFTKHCKRIQKFGETGK